MPVRISLATPPRTSAPRVLCAGRSEGFFDPGGAWSYRRRKEPPRAQGDPRRKHWRGEQRRDADPRRRGHSDRPRGPSWSRRPFRLGRARAIAPRHSAFGLGAPRRRVRFLQEGIVGLKGEPGATRRHSTLRSRPQRVTSTVARQNCKREAGEVRRNPRAPQSSTAEPRVAESSDDGTTAHRLSNQESEMAEAAAGVLIDTIMLSIAPSLHLSRGGAGPRGSKNASSAAECGALVLSCCEGTVLARQAEHQGSTRTKRRTEKLTQRSGSEIVPATPRPASGHGGPLDLSGPRQRDATGSRGNADGSGFPRLQRRGGRRGQERTHRAHHGGACTGRGGAEVREGLDK